MATPSVASMSSTMLSSRRGRCVSPKLDSNCVTPRTYTSVPRLTSANRSSNVFLIVSVNTSVPAINDTPSITTTKVSAVRSLRLHNPRKVSLSILSPRSASSRRPYSEFPVLWEGGRSAVEQCLNDVGDLLTGGHERQTLAQRLIGRSVRRRRGRARNKMRRYGAIPTARRPDVLAQMICARVLARSAYSQGARDRPWSQGINASPALMGFDPVGRCGGTVVGQGARA